MGGPMKRFLMLVAALLVADASFAASASTPGAQLTEEAQSDRNFRLYRANIINNYAVKTAPGAADSSIAWELNGANRLSFRFYPIVSDSAGHVLWQRVFIRVSYGDGATTDSTGHFPPLQITSDAAGDSIGPFIRFQPHYQTSTTAPNAILFSQPGEIAIDVPPYDKLGHDYVTIRLPDSHQPPEGALTFSLRARVGYVQMNTTIRGATTNAIDTKWTMAYRFDAVGGRE
jgi:hypothetical protein